MRIAEISFLFICLQIVRAFFDSTSPILSLFIKKSATGINLFSSSFSEEPGAEIKKVYKFKRKIGKGATAIVYEGKHKKTGKIHARTYLSTKRLYTCKKPNEKNNTRTCTCLEHTHDYTPMHYFLIAHMP